MNFKNSIHMLKEAKKATPLGAQTYSKSYRYHVPGHAPLFIERGKGSKVWDIDGNRFIDFVSALGPVSVGYSDWRVNHAIKKQLKKGITFSLPHPISITLANKLTKIIPGVEMVRFLKNGADATFAAVKLARAYTNKDLILMSGYHGMHDWSISTSENSLGVPDKVKGDTIRFDYNDRDALIKLVKKYENSIAAIILEPIQSNGPEEGYLSFIRNLCSENSILLIFDEVVSGFRHALGGTSELYGITPDLLAFGKGLANGMPLSVVAGKREIIEMIETHKVFISTTFGGETLSMAAALKTIDILESKTFSGINQIGLFIKEGLLRQVREHELENVCKIIGLPAHCGPVFNDFDNVDKFVLASIFSVELVKNKILSVGIINFSLSHTLKDAKSYLKATNQGFISVKQFLSSTREYKLESSIDPVFRR